MLTDKQFMDQIRNLVIGAVSLLFPLPKGIEGYVWAEHAPVVFSGHDSLRGLDSLKHKRSAKQSPEKDRIDCKASCSGLWFSILFGVNFGVR